MKYAVGETITLSGQQVRVEARRILYTKEGRLEYYEFRQTPYTQKYGLTLRELEANVCRHETPMEETVF